MKPSELAGASAEAPELRVRRNPRVSWADGPRDGLVPTRWEEDRWGGDPEQTGDELSRCVWLAEPTGSAVWQLFAMEEAEA